MKSSKKIINALVASGLVLLSTTASAAINAATPGQLAAAMEVPAADLARELGVTEARAQAVYDDIANKRRTTRYLHAAPVLVEPVTELAHA